MNTDKQGFALGPFRPSLRPCEIASKMAPIFSGSSFGRRLQKQYSRHFPLPYPEGMAATDFPISSPKANAYCPRQNLQWLRKVLPPDPLKTGMKRPWHILCSAGPE